MPEAMLSVRPPWPSPTHHSVTFHVPFAASASRQPSQLLAERVPPVPPPVPLTFVNVDTSPSVVRRMVIWSPDVSIVTPLKPMLWRMPSTIVGSTTWPVQPDSSHEMSLMNGWPVWNTDELV